MKAYKPQKSFTAYTWISLLVLLLSTIQGYSQDRMTQGRDIIEFRDKNIEKGISNITGTKQLLEQIDRNFQELQQLPSFRNSRPSDNLILRHSSLQKQRTLLLIELRRQCFKSNEEFRHSLQKVMEIIRINAPECEIPEMNNMRRNLLVLESTIPPALKADISAFDQQISYNRQTSTTLGTRGKELRYLLEDTIITMGTIAALSEQRLIETRDNAKHNRDVLGSI